MPDSQNQSDSVCDYFQQFLPRLIGRPLIPNLKGLRVLFTIYFTDLGQGWTLQVDSGRLLEIHCNEMPDSECRYALDTETFLKIAAAKVAPHSAFFARRIEIEGNIVIGLKLAMVMKRFFQEHPYPA